MPQQQYQNSPDLQLAVAAHNFHTLAVRHNRQLCLTAAGGSANCAAGVLSRKMQISYPIAHGILDFVGGPDWYYWLGLDSIPMDYWDDLHPSEGKGLVDLMVAAIKASKRGIRLQ